MRARLWDAGGGGRRHTGASRGREWRGGDASLVCGVGDGVTTWPQGQEERRDKMGPLGTAPSPSSPPWPRDGHGGDRGACVLCGGP